MLTPEQIRELEQTIQYRLTPQGKADAHAALTTLADALLQAVGAPRRPIAISRERLAEIEARLDGNPAGFWVPVDHWNHVMVRLPGQNRGGYYRQHFVMGAAGLERLVIGPHPTLRACLEAPVVARQGEPLVQWFEVES